MQRSTPIRVQMLGSFTLSAGNAQISDSDNRAKKVWLFLAYLIYRKGQLTEAADCIDLLWERGESGVDPANSLKTILHRVRTTLDRLWPGAGHELVLRQGSLCRWNPEYPVELDVDEFDRLCAKAIAAKDDDERLKNLMAALELYKGGFLSRFSAHLWVVPIAAHYHQLYIQAAIQAVALLRQRGEFAQMEAVCRAALEQDPYTEELYYHLMDALLRQGCRQDVATVYENMARLLMDNFGVMPSDHIRALYREALSELNDRSLPVDAIMEQLREPGDARGALVCQYDIFRSIYHSQARAIVRSGDVVHLALISVQSRDREKPLPKRSLDRAMDNLQDVIQSSLRRGDIAARCSVSQFIVMLPQANFENSQMVCQRIRRAFTRQYPHSPADIQCSVHALEPN